MAMINVRTNYGDVQGVMAAGGGCSIFRGIPFAKPPVGELRFAPPQRPESWSGVRKCDTFSPAPIQPTYGGAKEMSEDCLYLNIWTPAESADEKLPVMFWIYGGAFTFGHANERGYDGEAIAAKGCIYVSINYRVNIFGFFNTPELTERNGGPKCCGILDQIAALDWVRENISAFGGDPDNILIFGQSAGGMSTRMLLTSPLTEGKIAKAVVHSGGALSEGDLVRPADEFTDMCVRTLEHVGWSFDDIMQKDAQEVFDVMMPAVRETMNDGDLQYFQPFIDGCALTGVPGVRIYNGEYHDVPIMCGTVAGDSWMFSRKVRKDLEGNDQYFKGFALSPSIAWGRHNIKAGYRPIYSYYFDRKQPPKEIKYYTHGQPPFGADTPHASELAYIFGTLDVIDDRYQAFDYRLAEILRTYWTNFAKTGNPNCDVPEASDSFKTTEEQMSCSACNACRELPFWPEFAAGCELTMHFGDTDVKAENMVGNDDIERVIAFCEKTPGMLCSLEGF